MNALSPVILSFFLGTPMTTVETVPEGAPRAYQVSTACGTQEFVTYNGLHDLISEGHELMDTEKRVRCPGFFAKISKEIKGEAARRENRWLMNNCNKTGPSKEANVPNITPEVSELIQEWSQATNSRNIDEWVLKMSDGSMWPTRFHRSSHNNKVAEWIAGEFRRLAEGRTDVHIRLVDHVDTPQKSVEVKIDGQGENMGKYVVLGGHQDSIHKDTSRWLPDSRSPGADDNASGIAVLLETFRVMMESNVKPNATVVFYTYAAEEIGLVGSQEIASEYAENNREVLGVLQLDMTMFSENRSNRIKMVGDYTSKELNSLAKTLLVEHLNMETGDMTCGYACSDHASWNRYDFPAIMPAEDQVYTGIRRIHTSNDVNDEDLDAGYSERFAKLALAFAATMAY
jgi:leucyl aminopeptidase